jgi:hypothetical protein
MRFTLCFGNMLACGCAKTTKKLSHKKGSDSDIHDVRNDDPKPDILKAPRAGMQVRLETMYFGVFFHLKKLLGHVEKTRFFLDRDPGLDSACIFETVDVGVQVLLEVRIANA